MVGTNAPPQTGQRAPLRTSVLASIATRGCPWVPDLASPGVGRLGRRMPSPGRVRDARSGAAWSSSSASRARTASASRRRRPPTGGRR